MPSSKLDHADRPSPPEIAPRRSRPTRGLKIRSLVLPDHFQDHDKPDRMYAQAGLDSAAIVKRVFEILGRNAGVLKARA